MPASVRIGLCCGAVWLASCAAPSVAGKYQLPQADVRQIHHVLFWTIGIPKPIVEISGDDPTHAHALTGEGFVYRVHLQKKGSDWVILSKELFMITG
jgi:hypothetical protein